MKPRGARCLALLLATAIGGCVHSVPDHAGDRVSIMTFNVENLFDTVDDPTKNDETYLPLAAKQSEAHRAGCARISVAAWRRQCLELDWSEAVLKRKLAAVAGAVLANGPGGAGPDILVLQEVENAAVVERLRTDYLGKAGYGPVVLLEGDDVRGIDVAFLSRLPIAGSPVLHRVAHKGVTDAVRGDTRGILEATFALPGGALLTGFAVHFPAPFHPAAMRIEAYRALNARLAALPAGRLAFAAGDFNTIAAESALLDRWVEPDWMMAHRTGCADCRGTYYYAPNEDWSFLDMILVSRATASPWALDPSSVRVANASPRQNSDAGTPLRFDPETATGVSDHWPITVDLRRRP